MPAPITQKPPPKSRVSREMFFAVIAVAGLAIALAQPAVMSLSGLDLSRQRVIGPVDTLAVGAIGPVRNVHGLAGILKPLRLRD